MLCIFLYIYICTQTNTMGQGSRLTFPFNLDNTSIIHGSCPINISRTRQLLPRTLYKSFQKVRPPLLCPVGLGREGVSVVLGRAR